MADRFLQRLNRLGSRKLFLNYDTIAGVVTFIIVGFFTHWQIDYSSRAEPLLGVFMTIAATFFSIILAAFAVFSAFTDEKYLLSWIETRKLDNIITIFQFNLYTPIIVLLISLFLKIVLYSDLLMIFTISLFVYMVISLAQLVGFMAEYSLQKGEFLESTRNAKELRK